MTFDFYHTALTLILFSFFTALLTGALVKEKVRVFNHMFRSNAKPIRSGKYIIVMLLVLIALAVWILTLGLDPAHTAAVYFLLSFGSLMEFITTRRTRTLYSPITIGNISVIALILIILNQS